MSALIGYQLAIGLLLDGLCESERLEHYAAELFKHRSGAVGLEVFLVALLRHDYEADICQTTHWTLAKY